MFVEGIFIGLGLIFEAVIIGRMIYAYRQLEKLQYQQAAEKRKNWNNAWN